RIKFAVDAQPMGKRHHILRSKLMQHLNGDRIQRLGHPLPYGVSFTAAVCAIGITWMINLTIYGYGGRNIAQHIAWRKAIFYCLAVYKRLEGRARLPFTLLYMIELKILKVDSSDPCLHFPGLRIHRHQACVKKP